MSDMYLIKGETLTAIADAMRNSTPWGGALEESTITPEEIPELLDFIRQDGYDEGYDAGYEDSAGTSTVTTLVGTSWVFKDVLNLTGLTSGTLSWSILLKSATSSVSPSSGQYSYMQIKYRYNGQKYYYELYYATLKVYDTLSGWVDTKYKYVDVISGTNATNATTIATFTKNAFQRFDEYLEALGELCEVVTVVDSAEELYVAIFNRHPTYYLHCSFIHTNFTNGRIDIVVAPNSVEVRTVPNIYSDFRVDNVRWKANAT